ncbi:DsbA family protein [Hylemonella gracilis]|uniref:Disulfide isomerase-like protein n=1 Tax=Hylemonella gracilis ATCC 19624 TaxID=887062 RepID=F3KQC7_9BURK|nr:thioredoxin domain-containing protein [Hylemonella gracilis]EGI78000.1 disulfide isomerase-like protein [Hylemonella gracilis ATCC 19624]
MKIMKPHARTLALLALLITVVAVFVLGVITYQRHERDASSRLLAVHSQRLVRMHAAVAGPQDAPVTIVEFFDPACETCRAFHPIVKDLLRQYPKEVRLVVRYAPFHPGSDDVVRLLEAAKRQGKYWEVLDMVLAAQPLWADHGQPDVGKAYAAAAQTGLNLEQALADAASAGIESVLRQDIEDLTALGVNKTPTFFVNGQSLPSFGEEPLRRLVAEEVARAQR